MPADSSRGAWDFLIQPQLAFQIQCLVLLCFVGDIGFVKPTPWKGAQLFKVIFSEKRCSLWELGRQTYNGKIPKKNLGKLPPKWRTLSRFRSKNLMSHVWYYLHKTKQYKALDIGF